MTPRRPRLVFLGGFEPSKQRPSRVIFEKYQKVASLGPLRRSFLPRGSRFGAIRNREAASVVREKHVTASGKRGRVSIASRGTGTRLNFSSVSVVASLGTRYRRDQESSPRFERAPRGPSLGVREKTKNVFRLDRFRGPGQSLGRASCSSRRRISRRALLAV